MDKQNVASHAACIKAREYLALCDRLGFHYTINSFGEAVFREGNDWRAFYELRSRVGLPPENIMKVTLVSLGRIDPPYQPKEGTAKFIDPMTGFISEEQPLL